MYLDVIRHGATSSTQGHRFNDHEHEPLAHEALTSLVGVDFDASKYDRVDASSLRRAVQTAEGLGLTGFMRDARLSERGLGIFRGLTAAQCLHRHREDFEAFNAFEADYCIPGGESRGAHLARVLAWLDDVRKSGAGHALAVTHGGVLDFLRRLGTGEPIHGGAFNGGGLLALSRFDIIGPRLRLISFAEPLTTNL
jgi:broad specificity phosphatase PhoE